jgi:large subunit ribosomal protein L32
MAVPKKRTSRTRRDSRRSHNNKTRAGRAARPRLNECPRCHSPRLPHRVCPVCGTYAGREVIVQEVEETPAESPAEPQAEAPVEQE